MTIARSRLTAQGQISIPAEVRRKLGVGPGSVIEWEAAGRKIVVRRAGRYSSQEIHQMLFPKGPPRARSMAELKAGITRYIRKRHARRP
ncbi:MAG: AbrB/MazE/SpoVT family DNA-binding domain-containing protein [Acidobacteria bacterium]|nr:AbrB/MazE/SpoVT family DNA-binding domain-containing protein [Acidobacteriota bacterium]